jgi:hypothetical protein
VARQSVEAIQGDGAEGITPTVETPSNDCGYCCGCPYLP